MDDLTIRSEVTTKNPFLYYIIYAGKIGWFQDRKCLCTPNLKFFRKLTI